MCSDPIDPGCSVSYTRGLSDVLLFELLRSCMCKRSFQNKKMLIQVDVFWARREFAMHSGSGARKVVIFWYYD